MYEVKAISDAFQPILPVVVACFLVLLSRQYFFCSENCFANRDVRGELHSKPKFPLCRRRENIAGLVIFLSTFKRKIA